MNEEQQVELLCRVDIFESLPKEEVREILRDLLQRNAEINLQAGEVFYTPRQPDGKLFILKQGRVRPARYLSFQLGLEGVPLAQREAIDFFIGCLGTRRRWRLAW